MRFRGPQALQDISGQRPPPSTQSPLPEPRCQSGRNAPRKKAALTAEPCCASDSSPALNHRASLTEFQNHTTTPKGWDDAVKGLPLRSDKRKLHALDSA